MFGKLKITWKSDAVRNKYLYNGKELQEELETYDYGFLNEIKSPSPPLSITSFTDKKSLLYCGSGKSSPSNVACGQVRIMTLSPDWLRWQVFRSAHFSLREGHVHKILRKWSIVPIRLAVYWSQ